MQQGVSFFLFFFFFFFHFSMNVQGWEPCFTGASNPLGWARKERNENSDQRSDRLYFPKMAKEQLTAHHHSYAVWPGRPQPEV